MGLSLTQHSSVVTTPLSDEPRVLQPPGKPALPGHGDRRDLADVPTGFQVGPQPPTPPCTPEPLSASLFRVFVSPQSITTCVIPSAGLRLLGVRCESWASLYPPGHRHTAFHTVTIAINIWPIVMYPNYLLQVSLVLSYHDFPPRHKPVSSAS